MKNLPLVLLIFSLSFFSDASTALENNYLKQGDSTGLNLEQFIIKTVSQHISLKGKDASFMYRTGSPKEHCEMRDFVIQPTILPLSKADRMNGVDLKCKLRLSSSVYRTRVPESEWGDWVDGTPMSLSISMYIKVERRWGQFNVIQSTACQHFHPKWVDQNEVKSITLVKR